MPRALSTAAKNALRGTTDMAMAWLIDLYCDEGTLSGWNQAEPITYDGTTYEPLRDGFEISGEIRVAGGLVAEPLTITFDAAAQLDNTSFIGRFADRSWHQRRMRILGVIFAADGSMATPIATGFEWHGVMDARDFTDEENAPRLVTLTCEGGTFRVRERNLQVCTDGNQKERSAGDTFFQNISVKPQQDIPFGLASSKIPGFNRGRNFS